MRSNEDIVKALGICSTINGTGPECADCPYWPIRGTGCMNKMMGDAAAVIAEFEETVEPWDPCSVCQEIDCSICTEKLHQNRGAR